MRNPCKICWKLFNTKRNPQIEPAHISCFMYGKPMKARRQPVHHSLNQTSFSVHLIWWFAGQVLLCWGNHWLPGKLKIRWIKFHHPRLKFGYVLGSTLSRPLPPCCSSHRPNPPWPRPPRDFRLPPGLPMGQFQIHICVNLKRVWPTCSFSRLFHYCFYSFCRKRRCDQNLLFFQVYTEIFNPSTLQGPMLCFICLEVECISQTWRLLTHISHKSSQPKNDN